MREDDIKLYFLRHFRVEAFPCQRPFRFHNSAVKTSKHCELVHINSSSNGYWPARFVLLSNEMVRGVSINIRIQTILKSSLI